LEKLPLDIETAPMQSYHWQAKTTYIPHPMNTQETTILCASYQDPVDGKIKTLSVNPKRIRHDKSLCKELHRLLTWCADENIIVLYQNGDRFDLPKIKGRCVMNGIRKPIPELHTVDTLKGARTLGYDYNRLDYLDQKLHPGIGGKVKTRGWGQTGRSRLS